MSNLTSTAAEVINYIQKKKETERKKLKNKIEKGKKKGSILFNRGKPGIEPGTSRTLSGNHTSRPHALLFDFLQLSLIHINKLLKNTTSFKWTTKRI